MAAIRSILELMTSPFGLESMQYCSFKVLLEGKLPHQNFFRNLRLQFQQPQVGQIDLGEAGSAESKLH